MSAEEASPHDHSLAELAGAFLKIGLLGFGGVAVMARRVLVEERGWFDDEAYAQMLGLAQALPGANTVNLAVLIGDRAQGSPGALAALAALIAPPLALLIAILLVYDRIETLPLVRAALAGMASTGAGLVFGTGLRLAWGLRRRRTGLLFGLAAMVLVAGLHAPLAWTALFAGLASMLYAAWALRREARA
ncbi:MAG: chromate transporter [Alphaproteobacteria bacterium]|nr:chromate transporter [Alphaproteobacteria bacterium]